MADIKTKTDNTKKGGGKPPVPKVDKTIECLHLITDRSDYEGLKTGYYPLGFEPVQRWAKYADSHKGVLLAKQIKITEKEYEKGKAK